jgi:hypothetical protein
MKSSGLSRLLMAAALAAATGAYAASDVGLINHLAGDVSYSSGAATSRAQPYMKVREGDRFTVPAGAQVRVVYFQGGRQETFAGPASFTAGGQSSSVQSGSAPQVTTLPAGVPQKISQTPELIQIAKLGRAGGVAVRGVGGERRLTPQQQAEVRQARQIYQQLRASAAADDITPELYLYSVLQDHLLYGEMKPVVEEMARRQPDSADVAELRAYVKAKTE